MAVTKKEWSARIIALRERLGQTQDVFADTIGLKTRGAVSKLENGDKIPTGTLQRLIEHIENNFGQNEK